MAHIVRINSTQTRKRVRYSRRGSVGVSRGVASRMATAAELLRAHTFETRDKNVPRPCVQRGTLVKVGIRGERFWCRVGRVREDGWLLATVDNDLTRSPWRRGDEIVLQRSHVLEASEPWDVLTFSGLLAALGSASEAAMVWRDLRGLEAAKPRPRSWFVLP